MTTNIDEIRKRILEKFPDKGYELLSFKGVNHPVEIVCPEHGPQTVSRFNNFIRSVHGCPACAEAVISENASKNVKSFQQSVNTLRSLAYDFDRLASLPPEQFKSEVLEVLGKVRQKPPAKQAAEQPEPPHPEGFVPVPGFPDYSVSRDGRVYGLNEKAMLHGRWRPAHGMMVTLHGKRLSKTLPVARLVYSAFHPGVPLTGFVVRHKNGDYADNSLDNLYPAAESEKPPKREVIVYDKESHRKLAFPSIQSAAAAVGASTVSAVSRRLKDPELRKTPINGRYEVLGYGR